MMIIKILSPLLMALGWYLYVLLDHGNDGAVRWPGVSLIVIGILLIPAYHLLTVKKGRVSTHAPVSGLFKLSLAMLLIALLCLAAVFNANGFDGFYWLIPAALFGLAGLLMLIASLFTSSKSHNSKR